MNSLANEPKKIITTYSCDFRKTLWGKIVLGGSFSFLAVMWMFYASKGISKFA